MASSDTQNVVVNSKSMGESPVDAHVQNRNSASAANGANLQSSAPAVQEPDTSATANVNEKSALLNGRLSAQSQRADGSDAHVNGNGLVDGSVADTASVQGSVPDFDSRDALSVGDAAVSDTDSRGDSGEQGKDANGNLKAGVKKPTSFKAVSVTKNFLAKTATSTPTVKSGEKLSAPTVSAPQTMARPRLVAKSGSGLRDSPRPRTGAEGPTEAATVWNKNRPAPPQPPKQFTDEELKQQYGIHLASRIQVDEGSKQSKGLWADIDDEEDDWAPETLEWMDGTKSKVSADPVPPPKPTEQPQPPEAKPNMTSLKRPVPTGPPKTILRPGAAQIKQEAANKGTPEQKSAALAKGQAPAPVKSPWATLPPVDKSTPMFEPPPPPPPASKPAFGSQDARFMDNSDAPMVRHEIEADTFDRSWRDSSTGPRELFNSQSGRYEPAPEGGRRASVRHDQGYRQATAAVLQRPSNDNEEPSPGHQRPQMDGSPWGRRRGSSMSQGPQNNERRVSITHSQQSTDPAVPSENRTGIVIGHDIGPQARKASDAAQRMQQQINDRNEELAKQKRIMQEKREAAIRRRREEEEREEAAKRERIRLKLESLGMSLPEKKEETEEKVETKAEAPPQPAQSSLSTSHPAGHAVPSSHQANQPQNEQQISSTSPVKGRPLENAHSDPGSLPKPAQPSFTTTHNQAGRPPTSVPNRGFQDSSVPVSSYSSPGEQKVQPGFKSPALVADTFATWGNRTTSNHGPPASNVWGPPVAGRHIGNGAFDSSFGRIPPRLQNQSIMGQTFAGPGNARSPSAGNRQQETSPMRHQQMLSDQNLAALGLVDTPTDSFPSVASAGPSPMPAQAQPVALPPIGPPTQRQASQPFQQQAPPRGPAAWDQFAARAQAEQHAPYDPARQPPVASTGHQQQWKETFKQTRVGGEWNGAARSVVGAEKIVHGPTPSARPAPSPAPTVSQTQQTGGPVAGDGQENTVRLPTGPPALTPVAHRAPQNLPAHPIGAHQSRFFPTNLHGGSPPPEESSHPVQSGDKIHPKVNLPHPKPKVRLPQSPSPANVHQAHPSPVTMPQRAPSFRGIQPLVASSDWQARFNGLFGRIPTTTATPPSPPKTPPKMAAVPSPAPVSSSKADVFEAPVAQSATVSLPVKATAPVSQTTEMAIKPTSDELFDGELSFGSTPKIAVPNQPLYDFGPDRERGPHILRMRPDFRYDRRVEPSSRSSEITNLLDKPPHIATIKLSSSTNSVDVALKIAPKTKINEKLGEKRKPSGKFGKSPKIGTEKENEGSPVGTPAKINGPELKNRQVSQNKLPKGPKGYKSRQASERFPPKEGSVAEKQAQQAA